MKAQNYSHPRHHKGATLVVVLILLLIMTLLGLATLRGTIMEERMSSNMYDRSLSFQSAEIALREAESLIRSGPLGGIGIAIDCTQGSASSNTDSCSPIPPNTYTGSSGVAWSTASATHNGSVSAGSPQYLIQYMGVRDTTGELGIAEDPNYGGSAGLVTGEYYRITGRSNDPASASGKSRALTVLQATVVRE